MIKLYNSDRQTVIKVLNPTQSIVTRQLMGGWSMELFHPFNEAGALIERGLYIECSTPKGLQKFKVRMVTKISENTIRVTAFHRFYDLCNNYVRDTNVVGKNRQQAISQILSNTLRPTTFIVEGHSTATNNLRIVGLDPFTAIVGNQDNSVINRYGGEWDCDNDMIIVEDYVGTDRGYLVAWDKNMTELNESIDDTGLITQIIPVGRERLMLPEVTVDSVYINSYEDIYTREIAFSDIGVDEDNNIDEAEAQRLLRLAAEKYFRETECDILKANYEVSIKDIKNNPKYEECSFFNTLDIGDFVTVLKNNGLRIKVRLLEYQYDSIKEEFISFKLNALGKKLTSNTTGIQGALDKILNTNGSLNSEKLEGLINMLTVSMGAMVDSAEKHRAKAILFEDRIPSSPTYGAMAVGTKGFMIASEFDATKQDWKWRTFGTGKGFIADLIIAGIIKGAGDDLIINLDTGEIRFKKGMIEGPNIKMDLNSGIFKSLGTNSEITIQNGIIKSNTEMILSALNNITLKYGANVNDPSLTIYDWGIYMTGDKVNIITGNEDGKEINLNSNKVFINNREVNPRIAALENTLLEQEGLL